MSFVSCCQLVLAAWDVTGERSGLEHRQCCVSRLEQVGSCLVGRRPGRFGPRVRTKRGGNYNLMMQPRGELRAQLAVGTDSFETLAAKNLSEYSRSAEREVGAGKFQARQMIFDFLVPSDDDRAKPV